MATRSSLSTPEYGFEFRLVSDPSDRPAPKPAQLQRYRFGAELGSGSYAQVFRARELATGRDYAAKVVNMTKFRVHPQWVQQAVMQEVQLLQELNHPGIVRLHEFFEANDKLYLLLELVEGGELFDRIISKGAYPEAEARKLMRGIFTAVAYLHDRDIVHRDLKPENILLSKDDPTVAKLADFGVARRVGPAGAKTMVGSPQYLAPEVLRRGQTVVGSGSYGKSADMWSLGVILYVVLAQSVPFRDVDLASQLEQVKFSFKSPVWGRISLEAKTLIKRLLTADVSARFTIQQALQHPWLHQSSLPAPRPRLAFQQPWGHTKPSQWGAAAKAPQPPSTSPVATSASPSAAGSGDGTPVSASVQCSPTARHVAERTSGSRAAGRDTKSQRPVSAVRGSAMIAHHVGATLPSQDSRASGQAEGELEMSYEDSSALCSQVEASETMGGMDTWPSEGDTTPVRDGSVTPPPSSAGDGTEGRGRDDSSDDEGAGGVSWHPAEGLSADPASQQPGADALAVSSQALQEVEYSAPYTANDGLSQLSPPPPSRPLAAPSTGLVKRTQPQGVGLDVIDDAPADDDAAPPLSPMTSTPQPRVTQTTARSQGSTASRSLLPPATDATAHSASASATTTTPPPATRTGPGTAATGTQPSSGGERLPQGPTLTLVSTSDPAHAPRLSNAAINRRPKHQPAPKRSSAPATGKRASAGRGEGPPATQPRLSSYGALQLQSSATVQRAQVAKKDAKPGASGPNAPLTQPQVGRRDQAGAAKALPPQARQEGRASPIGAAAEDTDPMPRPHTDPSRPITDAASALQTTPDQRQARGTRSTSRPATGPRITDWFTARPKASTAPHGAAAATTAKQPAGARKVGDGASGAGQKLTTSPPRLVRQHTGTGDDTATVDSISAAPAATSRRRVKRKAEREVGREAGATAATLLSVTDLLKPQTQSGAGSATRAKR